MDLVVDANIIFAALIKNGITLEIITEPDIHLFAPEFLFDEILKHKNEILEKTSRNEVELEMILGLLRDKIIFVPLSEFEMFLEEAGKFSPDEGDTMYLALALKLKIPVWSNDRALRDKQNRVKIYSTKDILV